MKDKQPDVNPQGKVEVGAAAAGSGRQAVCCGGRMLKVVCGGL